MSDPATVALWTSYAAIAASLATVFATPFVMVAAYQVIIAAKSHKVSEFAALLSLEAALGAARDGIVAACVELKKAEHEAKKSNDSPEDDEVVRILRGAVAAKSQQYHNLLDRLCSGIMHGQISEDLYRADYKELIAGAVEDMEVSGDKFACVLEVHKAWNAGKSARKK